MDWKAKVDLFEQLRREHEFGIGTIAGVAAKFGVHRGVDRLGGLLCGERSGERRGDDNPERREKRSGAT